jgi:hypothetical protein
MKKALAALSCAAVLVSAPGLAQTTAPISAPVSSGAVLRTGTPLPLKMAEALTTKDKATKVGQRVRLEVAENVLVDGRIVIPAGSPAMGEVTDVKNKGMWGKSGKINARVLYVTVNGRQIRASGQFDDKGKSGTAGVVGAAVLLPVAGFFVTGTSAEIALGAPVNGFVDEDVPLSFAATGAAPMTVPAPVATMSVPTSTATPSK